MNLLKQIELVLMIPHSSRKYPTLSAREKDQLMAMLNTMLEQHVHKAQRSVRSSYLQLKYHYVDTSEDISEEPNLGYIISIRFAQLSIPIASDEIDANQIELDELCKL